jgi:hypothetical protein
MTVSSDRKACSPDTGRNGTGYAADGEIPRRRTGDFTSFWRLSFFLFRSVLIDWSPAGTLAQSILME